MDSTEEGVDVSEIGDGVVEGASCVGTVVGAGTGDRGFSMVGALSVGAAGTQRVNLLNPVVGGRVPCRGLGGVNTGFICTVTLLLLFTANSSMITRLVGLVVVLLARLSACSCCMRRNHDMCNSCLGSIVISCGSTGSFRHGMPSCSLTLFCFLKSWS